MGSGAPAVDVFGRDGIRRTPHAAAQGRSLRTCHRPRMRTKMAHLRSGARVVVMRTLWTLVGIGLVPFVAAACGGASTSEDDESSGNFGELSGDEAALRAILDVAAAYKAFVGSRRKMAAIRERLAAAGASPEALDAIKGPAGIDIGAISPEEIALSILAEIIAIRREKQRAGLTAT